MTPTTVALGVIPAALLVLALALRSALRPRRAERALRKEMKRAAALGSAGRFFDAARGLITCRLAARWGVVAADITAKTIHERLGTKGETLAEVMVADEARRFARADADALDLASICVSDCRTLAARSFVIRGRTVTREPTTSTPSCSRYSAI